jgi:hypothetical protein
MIVSKPDLEILASPETMVTLNTGVVSSQNAFEERIAALNTNEKNNILID